MGGGHEGDVVVPARPGTPLEVVQAQAVLEVAVVVLDAPADLGRTDQVGDRGVGRQVGQPVIGRRLDAVRPFDQQPAVGPRFRGTEASTSATSNANFARTRFTSCASTPTALLNRPSRKTNGVLLGLY